jgi:hypothetical protein
VPQVSVGPPALPDYLEGEECRMNKGTETPVLKTHAIPARNTIAMLLSLTEYVFCEMCFPPHRNPEPTERNHNTCHLRGMPTTLNIERTP